MSNATVVAWTVVESIVAGFVIGVFVADTKARPGFRWDRALLLVSGMVYVFASYGWTFTEPETTPYNVASLTSAVGAIGIVVLAPRVVIRAVKAGPPDRPDRHGV